MKYICTAALCAFALSAAAAPPDQKAIFSAIFNNDTAALKKLVTNKESASVKDDRERSALLYACGFGSYQAAKLLVDAGADVNGATGLGATPLMWSITDPAKVKLLLEHGADVNAKSSSGRTALIIAAMTPGSDAVVDMLLAKGADALAADQTGLTFIGAASGAPNPRQVRIALERGAKADTADGIGITPLMNAASYGDLASVRLLLSKGADVNAVTKGGFNKVKNGPIRLGLFTPLLLAAPYSGPAVVDELIRAGAKLDVRDMRGMTPLMVAIATEHHNEETIRVLRAAGGTQTADADQWAAKYQKAEQAAVSKTDPVSKTVAGERALALLRKTGSGFMASGGCIACHAQPAATMAMKVALDHGFKITPAEVQEHLPLAKGYWGGMTERLMLRQDSPGGSDDIDYALLLLSSAGHQADTTTAAMIVNLLAQQLPDGGWPIPGIARAPMEDSAITKAAFSLRAMQTFSWPGREADLKASIERSRQWLKRATPVYNEEFATQLMGLKWTNDSTAPALAKKLAAMQNADGGWSQNPRLASDAYATGQTLYALHEAGMASSDPVYQRGVNYLRTTQQPDGSWHVLSRSPKFQPYFESGFPHGDDQWISTMGTAWAAMAVMM